METDVECQSLTSGLQRSPFRVLCHEASAVQTAARNFIGDEGRSFGFGDQVADPKPPQAALVKSHGGERCGKVGTMIPAGTVERGERKRTVDEVSKAD
jgi:hypothetical protein